MTEPTTSRLLAGLPKVTRLFAEFVAPTTLVTGLLFYFGWGHAYWFFDYFGVNSTVLGLTPTDYLMRGVDGLFVPMSIAAVVTLAAIWLRVVLAGRLSASTRDRARRVLVPVLVSVGGLLLVNGFSAIYVRHVFNRGLAVAPLSLAIGVVLLLIAVRRLPPIPGDAPWTGLVEWAAVFTLVGLGLFWAVVDYSAAVGRSRAIHFVNDLADQPEALVFSQNQLNLSARGAREVRCANTEGSYRFRYDGLTLVLQSDDQFVLLPRDWTKDNGVAVVLPRSDSVRIEFVRDDAIDSVPATC